MTVCMAMNVYTLYVYRKQHSAQTQQHFGQNFMANREKVERKLTMYVLITFLGQFLTSVYMVCESVFVLETIP